MRITKIEVVPVSVPFIEPYVCSLGAKPVGENILVNVYTDDGLVGIGETCPFPGFYPETQEDTIVNLRKYLIPPLIGKDPFDIERIIEIMDKTSWGAGEAHPIAKAPIDNALYDIMGKKLNIPVYKLLGGRYRNELRSLNFDLSLENPEKMAREAQIAVERGYDTLELKIGIDPKKDLKRVKVVRDAIGSDVGLRADANGAYNLTTAMRTLRKMEKYELDFFEQPLPAWDHHGMAQLAQSLDTPICADESAYTPEDVLRLIRMNAADMVCIKIGRSGLCKAKRIATITETADIPCIVGSMLPLGVGTAAIHHFVTATRNISEAGGVYTTPLDHFVDDIVKEPQRPEKGVIRVSEKPGLGVELDQEKIEKYRLRT